MRSCVARIDAAAVPAKPFPVEQMRAGEFSAHAGTVQPLDRLAVQSLSFGSITEQRARARSTPSAQSVPLALVISSSWERAPAAVSIMLPRTAARSARPFPKPTRRCLWHVSAARCAVIIALS